MGHRETLPFWLSFLQQSVQVFFCDNLVNKISAISNFRGMDIKFD